MGVALNEERGRPPDRNPEYSTHRVGIKPDRENVGAFECLNTICDYVKYCAAIMSRSVLVACAVHRPRHYGTNSAG